MWKQNKPEESQRFILVLCPVCSASFGQRDSKTIYSVHCEECKATFYWKAWTDKPSVIMDKDVSKTIRYCSKNGCYCR